MYSNVHVINQTPFSIASFTLTTAIIMALLYFVLKPIYIDPLAHKADKFNPSNGTWTNWSQWSECSKVIGDKLDISCGDQTRIRYCENQEDGGNDCEGNDRQNRACQHPECQCRHMTVSGNVVDEKSEPLARVKIFISGTTKLLTETDSDGKFYIKNLCNRTQPDSSVGIDLEIRGYYSEKAYQVQPVFEAIASRQAGSKAKSIQMMMATPPVIKSGPQSSFRLKGQVVKLCCDVGGNDQTRSKRAQKRLRKYTDKDPIDINWYRNGIRLNNKRYNFDNQNWFWVRGNIHNFLI